MSTRRVALGLAVAAPLAGASLAASRPAFGAPPGPAGSAGGPGERAAGSPAADPLTLVATRTQITLPAAPTLGIGYIATFDLVDGDGKAAGTAWSSSAVVDLKNTAQPVVFGMIVLHLADGDIHYQRVIDRFGDYPRKSTGAILGGTGSYAQAAGTVDVVWPDEKKIDLTVHLAG
jgi:hypothetical protein